MKRIILLAFMLIGSRLFAQEWKVVEWEGKTQSEIRSSLKAWVADYFKSAKDVIQLDEADRIILKGLTPLVEHYEDEGMNIPINFSMNFTIDFQIKESKFRYTVKDIYFKNSVGSYTEGQMLVENNKNKKEALKFKGRARKGIEASTIAVDRIVERSKSSLEEISKDIESIPLKTKSETENW
ncbi:DUF4468 domain-containing protein [Sphingobacterium sp.]|uniref:DUF4468 domain-containing protein n=1 Tax=Sphingobacterium sp. TaxID=341027 RepID=UPI002898C3D0|nr:DUF4468 domain-containing protein [Sphingobacterium sp.]